MVGLLLCGVLFGPYGLELIGKNRPIADFLAELGKLMLMFIAGLEINLGLFRQVQRRSMTFGLITTSIPLILGTLSWTLIWLSGRCGSCHRLTARIPHFARLADHCAVRRKQTRANHCYVWGDDALRHAFADRVRNLRLDI